MKKKETTMVGKNTATYTKTVLSHFNNKQVKGFLDKHRLKITIAVISAAFAGGLVVVMWVANSRPNNQTHPVSGQITEVSTSCGREILQSDGTIKHGPDICDGGNSIVINSMRISTGGGAATINPPQYITDISLINAGDVVEVKYINGANGYPSTDCQSCYIKELKTQKKALQIKAEH